MLKKDILKVPFCQIKGFPKNGASCTGAYGSYPHPSVFLQDYKSLPTPKNEFEDAGITYEPLLQIADTEKFHRIISNLPSISKLARA